MGSPTKNLQLLTGDLNKMAVRIANMIEAEDFTEIDKLAKNNIRVIVNDKAYGAPVRSARNRI